MVSHFLNLFIYLLYVLVTKKGMQKPEVNDEYIAVAFRMLQINSIHVNFETNTILLTVTICCFFELLLV